MKHFLSLCRSDIGTMSALTVGQKCVNTSLSGIKHASRMFLTLLMLLLLNVGNVWAEADETITFSEKEYSNQQAVASVSGAYFTIAFDKGTNSSNAPKYYTSGAAIRCYGGNTMTISSSIKTIEKIEITFGSGDGTNAITTDKDTYSSGTWSGSATSVTFTIGGTSGNRRLSAIAVTYTSGGGGGETAVKSLPYLG